MPRKVDPSRRMSEADRLYRLREALHLTQRELAEQFNVAPSAIAQWETARHSIPGPVLRLIELYERDLGLTTPEPPARSRFLARGLARSWKAVQAVALWPLVAGSGAGDGALRRQLRHIALEKYARIVGENKGLTMKLAQMGTYFEHLLPEPQRAQLDQLPSTCPAMAPRQVVDVFVDELGRTPTEMFARWESTPVAAASIGQVHRATTHAGERVAVKVQYPGVVDAAQAELDQLDTLDKLMCVFLRWQQRGVMSTEVRERFLEECDYQLEAGHQIEFEAMFADRDDIRIPATHEAESSRRILVSEWIDGQNVREFAATAPRGERDRAGRAIWDFYYRAALRHGVYNTDPNPGNFVFGDGAVTFLDFGRVRRLPGEFLASWRALMRAALERDAETFRDILIETGCTPDPVETDFRYANRVLLIFYRPFLQDGPFAFTSDYLRQMWRSFGPDNPNRFRVAYIAELIFFNQLYFGVNSMLARLGARVDCRSSMLDLLYRPGESRPEPYSDLELERLGV